MLYLQGKVPHVYLLERCWHTGSVLVHTLVSCKHTCTEVLSLIHLLPVSPLSSPPYQAEPFSTPKTIHDNINFPLLNFSINSVLSLFLAASLIDKPVNRNEVLHSLFISPSKVRDISHMTCPGTSIKASFLWWVTCTRPFSALILILHPSFVRESLTCTSFNTLCFNWKMPLNKMFWWQHLKQRTTGLESPPKWSNRSATKEDRSGLSDAVSENVAVVLSMAGSESTWKKRESWRTTVRMALVRRWLEEELFGSSPFCSTTEEFGCSGGFVDMLV